MAGRRRKNETMWAQTMTNAIVLVRMAVGKVNAPRHAAQSVKVDAR